MASGPRKQEGGPGPGRGCSLQRCLNGRAASTGASGQGGTLDSRCWRGGGSREPVICEGTGPGMQPSSRKRRHREVAFRLTGCRGVRRLGTALCGGFRVVCASESCRAAALLLLKGRDTLRLREVTRPVSHSSQVPELGCRTPQVFSLHSLGVTFQLDPGCCEFSRPPALQVEL